MERKEGEDLTPAKIKALRGDYTHEQVAEWINAYIREYIHSKVSALSDRSIERWEGGSRRIPPWYVFFLKKMKESA